MCVGEVMTGDGRCVWGGSDDDDEEVMTGVCVGGVQGWRALCRCFCYVVAVSALLNRAPHSINVIPHAGHIFRNGSNFNVIDIRNDF